ncbi:MAG: hypothetical protein PWP23_1726 [Candidatus Sumerlaeota bacterium]|nr:hypothetical protein [Candidatus Sumerlaeota bacterium]
MKDEELETAWGAFAATRTPEAFERLWNAGRGLAMRLAWMAVGDPDAAEDVVAALFARLWCDDSRALPAGLSARQALVRWTFDEARTANRRRWRQRGREAELEPLAASLPSDVAGPRAHAASRETAERVRTLIHTLPEKYREALIACEVQELTLAEAARSLGRPERTVQAQVRRGKALLERKLRGAGLTLSVAAALAAVGEHASAATTALTAAGIVERSAALVQNAGPLATASAGLSKAWLLAAAVAVVVLGTVGVVAWSNGTNGGGQGAPASVVAAASSLPASAPDAPAASSPSSDDAEAEEAAGRAGETGSADSSRSATLAELIEETEAQTGETSAGSTGDSEEELDGPVAEWTGRVVSAEGGIPIAGARVGQLEAKEGIGAFATEPLTPEATVTVTTDADGRYTLRIPAPEPSANSFLVFVAEAPGHGSLAAMTFSALVQPTGNRMDFELPAAGHITGRVVDGAMRPLAGTTVGYFILNEPDFTRIMEGPVTFATGWTTTGKDGGFALEALPQGWTLSVPVFAPGFPATVRDDIAVGVEDLTIIVEEAAGHIVGQVLAGGEPVPSITVTAVVPPEPNTMRLQRTLVERWTARTGEDGRFELAVPAAGPYQVLASGGEDSARRVTAAEVEVEAGGTVEVELSIPADAVVQGRVIEADTGSPIAGLGASTTPYFRDMPDGRTERIDDPDRTEVRTGADGLFTLQVPLILREGVGSASFYFDPPAGWIAANDDRISGYTVYLSKVAPGATVPVDIVLRRSAVLRGRTVDAAGTPVPNAGVGLRGRQTATAISDGEGGFEIAVPPGTDAVLTAMTPGLYGDAMVPVPAEGAVPELTIVMRETGIVGGTVLDADGKPAEGLFVQLWKNFAGGRTSSAVGTPSPVKTAKDGTFRFQDVPPGEVRVRVTRERSSMTDLNLPVSLELEPGGIRDDLIVRLRAAGRRIDGVVSDTEGALLKDVEVYAMVDLPEGDRPWSSSRVRTGADGYFAIEEIPDGELSVVWFHHADYESLPLSERSVEDAPFNVTMKRRREAVVRIVDAVTGAPQGRAAGRLLRQHGWGWQIVDGFNGVTPEKGDGIIHMGRLDDKTYLFQASELDAAGKATGRRGQVRFKPSELPSDAPLDVRVGMGSPAGGRVVMMDGGAPVEGARVYADVPTDNWNERQPPDARFDVEAVVTDSAGAFRFPSLGPGEHRIRVEKPGLFEAVPRWIVVQPGGESESVTIKMGVKKE